MSYTGYMRSWRYRVLSLTPRFSGVEGWVVGVRSALAVYPNYDPSAHEKTAKAVQGPPPRAITPLKQGVNERTARTVGGLWLLLGLLCLAPYRVQGQPIDGSALTNEIRQARFRLQMEHRELAPKIVDRLADTLGRSNYLARAIEMAIRGNDLANAELLFKQFPGKADDLGLWGQALLHQMVQYGSEAQLAFLLEHKARSEEH